MASSTDIGPILRSKKGLSKRLQSLQFVQTNGNYNIYAPGGFGLVYLAYDGNKQVAVKFYRERDANRGRRYELLNNFLRKTKVQEFRSSEYIDEAIYIEDEFEWLDALVVEYIEEKSLTAVIKECLQARDINSLNQIANRLMEVSERLASLNVVHGDIHPDNIFVSKNKDIILIDYDDVWIQGFLETPPKTAGYPGFQHPLRQTAKGVGGWLDNFSFGIIYIQMQILIQSMGVPRDHRENKSLPMDQMILFDEIDYSNPQKSEAFKKYALHKNLEIRCWMAVLINDFLAVTSLSQIPRPTINDLMTRFRSYLDPSWNSPPANYRIYNPKNLGDARFFLNRAMMSP